MEAADFFETSYNSVTMDGLRALKHASLIRGLIVSIIFQGRVHSRAYVH